MLQQNQPKDTLINMRVHSRTRDFIDQAAQAMGKGRSDFMLEAAVEKAEQVLMDRTYFVLNEEEWEAFNRILDNPPPAAKIRKLLAAKAPWE